MNEELEQAVENYRKAMAAACAELGVDYDMDTAELLAEIDNAVGDIINCKKQGAENES